jgi:hypothetical protein
MKFTEIENKTFYGQSDTKARRVLNTSKTIANITAKDIENGVSIEVLESLNVPVYRYQTQITIHGLLPDITKDTVNGYKSILLNGNGSIGVKYIAIDGEKKKLFKRTARALNNDGRCMSFHMDSRGVMLYKTFNDKTLTLEFLKTVPNCFIGCKYAAQSVYGGYYVVIELDAIPECNLWPMIEWFSCGNVKCLADIERLENEQEKEYQKRQAEYKQQSDDEAKNRLNAPQPLKDGLTGLGYEYYEGVKSEGIIVNPVANEYLTVFAYKAIEYKTYGKKFKSRAKIVNTLAELENIVFGDDWKMPNKYYQNTCKGFIKRS